MEYLFDKSDESAIQTALPECNGHRGHRLDWHDFYVVLTRPRFPENIGMVARACANLGCHHLRVVAPERWDIEKSALLSTHQGLEILKRAVIYPDLPSALADCHLAVGSSARLGGWRRAPLSPEKAALEVAQTLHQGGKAALVFGPEDTGLHNSELDMCAQVVNISTPLDATSLNLAQAVLLLLYECSKFRNFSDEDAQNLGDKSASQKQKPSVCPESRLANLEEYETLFALLKQTLLTVNYLKPDNPDWFMQPVKRFIRKAKMRRYEFSMLMGVCKKVLHLAKVHDRADESNCDKT